MKRREAAEGRAGGPLRKDKGRNVGGGKEIEKRNTRRKLALHGGLEYRPTPTGWLHHRHRLHLLRPTFCLPICTPRILHLQGGVTLKTLPVLNYPVPPSLSPSLSSFPPSVLFCLPPVRFFYPFLRRVPPTILSVCSILLRSVGLPSLLTAEIRAMTSRTSHPKSPSSSLLTGVIGFLGGDQKRIEYMF